MKKHLRVLAAILVLCFSLLCPAASAASVQTAACKPSAATVQTISAGKKDGADGLGPNARRQKISQQVYLQQYEKTRKRLHYRKQKRKASLLAKSAIKKIKNDLQSPCRKFSGRGFICVHKKFKNYYKEITEKLLQIGFKRVTIWLQQGQMTLLSVKSFFFLFLGISGTGSPPPAVLLHSRDPCAAQAVSRFVCKKARPFWTSFFASINHAKTGFSCGKV